MKPSNLRDRPISEVQEHLRSFVGSKGFAHELRATLAEVYAQLDKVAGEHLEVIRKIDERRKIYES